MSCRMSRTRPADITRIARSGAIQRTPGAKARDFRMGEMVRACSQVRNDGTYPHLDIGEVLVVENDLGNILETWRFLGELYYTIEFPHRGVVVIMRGREVTGIDHAAA